MTTRITEDNIQPGSITANSLDPNISIGGVSNAAVYIFNSYIDANTTIEANTNGLSIGPVLFANGVSLTIASGQRWIVI